MGKPAVYKDRTFLQYYHILCVFKRFRNARVASNVVSSTNALIGFADIAEKDQFFLKNLIASENLSRKKIPAASTQKPKAKVKPDAPLQVCKVKLKPRGGLARRSTGHGPVRPS